MIRRIKLAPHHMHAILERQGGLCAEWGCESEGPFDAEHILPLCLGGSNEADNWQLLCRPCHKRKTANDVSAKSKADRQGGRKGQWALRQKHGSKLKSASFRGWRRMDGSIVLK